MGSNRHHQEGPIDNSFQAPRESSPLSGHLDVVAAVSEGFAAAVRNLVPLVVAGGLGFFLYFVGFCTCVGWIPAVPLLFYGGLRMTLEAQLGKTKLSTLWSGTEDFGSVFLSMWGLMFLYGLLLLPTMLISTGLTLAKVDLVTASAISIPISVLYSLVIVRFQLTPFLIIDRKERVLDAFQRSWAVTGPVWGKMIALQLLSFLLMSPVQVMGVGMQMLNVNQPPPVDPDEALAMLYPMMALYFGVLVVTFVVGSLVWSFFAAAYRQLIGIETVQAERA